MPGPFYFAWAGGAIEDQVAVGTSGTTHGAAFQTATIVGDVESGGQQVVNLVSSQGLEAGALYMLAGPGIADGTFFVSDDSILAGLPDSINLSEPAAGSGASATFTATKSVAVATVAATLTLGSNTVDLGGITLPAGVYGIDGTGIGETDAVDGPGIMTVGSAYMVYDGTSGTGAMYLLAAQPVTSAGEDQFGQPITLTTYAVVEQPVRATTSGIFGAQLTGFPDADPASVTDIPSGSLLSLMPGLVYNIAGNGLPIGATFVAPSSGATAIALDLAATASDTGTILTITGPRTPNAPFDPAGHARFDEDILSVDIAQDEGGFATLTVEMRNPNVGLLATGRHLWCWLSWDQAWTPEGGAAPDLVPLFNGRLVGVPKLAAGEVVQLEFLARPDDLNAQKAALAASLQVLPWYDPVWLASNITPDTVLETYSALWHIDRVSLAMSVSDIIDGEDGTVDIGEDQSIYDRFALSYGQPPLSAVEASGTVSWTQQAEGSIDVTEHIVRAFAAAGSGYKHAFSQDSWGGGGGGLIQCLCGDGLKSDWPKPGTSIGGGWNLSTLNDPSGSPLCFIVDATSSTQGGWIQPTWYRVNYTARLAMPPQTGTEDRSNVNVFLHPYGEMSVSFPLNVYKTRMVLQYKASRTRTETVSAVVAAGVQRQLSDSTESDRESVSLTSQYVGEAVDAGGAVPIGNPAYRSYFQTGRGAASFEYLLLAARAKLRARARSVEITFAVDWRTALGLGLRHSVRYADRRVPGGVATGKVKSYRLTAGSGGMVGEFTIGCTIGTGDGTAPLAGEPAYVDDGYVFSGYQIVPGGQVPLLAGDEIAYESFDSFAVIDDGLDLTALTADKAVNECVVANGLTTQLPAMDAFQNTIAPTGGDPLGVMTTLTTRVTLDLKPVQGSEFHTHFYPAVTPLVLPKTIDLSAAAPGAR